MTSSKIPSMNLNNGINIPMLGLGVYQMNQGSETYNAVLFALKAGYRHIDTAAFYRNEKDVGRAVRESGIPRDEIFITTKLANQEHDDPVKAFEQSNTNLGLDYINLYLIHWPVPGKRDATWRFLETLYAEKKVRAIGVSNYTIRHLKELLSFAKVIPAVNQVEFSPFLYQKELLHFCKEKKIQLEAYSPLTRGHKLDDPRLAALSTKYKKSPAQLLIRWAIQHDVVVIPKSSKERRIKENADVFDFTISLEDMQAMDAYNENCRFCWDPTDAP
ncbi:MAG: aldo/keto reductase [Nanoarchaeota archaeon]